jgi:hypothetical protein
MNEGVINKDVNEKMRKERENQDLLGHEFI